MADRLPPLRGDERGEGEQFNERAKRQANQGNCTLLAPSDRTLS